MQQSLGELKKKRLAMDHRIFHLIEQILENLQHDWRVEEMAKLAGLSETHIQKLFKSKVGMPPITWLREKRLEKAREFLEAEDTHFHINEIGRKVGMSNESHFSRDFKKKFGVSPKEYRKQYWVKIFAERLIGKK
jgi:AraC-like DNA-binding protein